MTTLFIPGAPGGPEIFLILVMFFMYVVIPLAVIVAIYNFLDGKRGYERRITALEERVDELESEQS